MGAKKPGRAGLSQSPMRGVSRLVVALGRRDEAFEAAQQVFLGHAVEGSIVRVVAGHRPAPERPRSGEQRHGLGLRLVDLDVLLQRVDQVFLEVVRARSSRRRSRAARRPGSCRGRGRWSAARRTRSGGRGGWRAAPARSGSRPCRCNLRRSREPCAAPSRVFRRWRKARHVYANQRRNNPFEPSRPAMDGRAVIVEACWNAPVEILPRPWNVPRARLDLPDRLCDVRRFDGAA